MLSTIAARRIVAALVCVTLSWTVTSCGGDTTTSPTTDTPSTPSSPATPSTPSTPSKPPVVTTADAANVGSTAGTVHGTVDPSGAETTVWFEWGTNTNSLNVTSTTTNPVGVVNDWAATLTGLLPSTTYSFRIVGQNSGGTTRGAFKTFTTCAAAGCSAATPTVTHVSVSPATTSVNVGSTATFTATATDASGSVVTGRPITWASSNAAVATVDANGVARGVAAGTVQITATIGGVTGSASLTVAAVVVKVATVTVSLASTTITVGQTTQATATLRDASGTVLTGRAITWSSSNTNVARVDATSGLVTAAGVGSATITATSEGITGSATITVNAPAVAPTATTNDATSVSTTSATLQGTVNPNGSTSTVWFEWGTSTTSLTATGTGTNPATTVTNWTENLTNLQPSTTYTYRIVAQNAGGITRGAFKTFTTGAVQTGPTGDHTTSWDGGESDEPVATLTASNPRFLDNTPFTLTQTTTVIAFTAQQFTSQFWVLDRNNAQAFVNGSAFNGFQLAPLGQAGLNFVTLPAGTYFLAAQPNQTVFSGYSNTIFMEVSWGTFPKWTFSSNVPLALSGANPGAWKSQGFTVGTSDYRAEIETEGSDGVFAVMTAAQFQTYQAKYANGYTGGGFDAIFACGGQQGGIDLEIECEMKLTPGSYVLIYINTSNRVAGGAGNINFYRP
ncbi:MAG TPA: Ig-like domain-containing protein [Gemmatimonadaceae bacterium]|nr:Ig-like domain-containing protein [Gemmatimonadaceae bacterium]